MKNFRVIKKSIAFLCVLFCLPYTYGQDVQVSATVDQNVVQLNQTFNYQITVETQNNEDVSDPRLSALKGLEFLSLNQSQSTQFSTFISNGKMETHRVRSQVFTYVFQAMEEGKLVIPPAEIYIGQTSYKTNQIEITVQTDPVPQNQQKRSSRFFGFEDEDDIFSQFFGRGNKRLQKQFPSQDQNIEDAFFIHVEVDKDEVYVGEQLTVAWYLYTQHHITDINTLKYPLLKGFWKEDIQVSTRLSFTQEIHNGIVYKKALLAKYALFPISAGTSQIDSYDVQCLVVGDSFFGRFGFGQPKTYKDQSKVLSIKVKPLPVAGRPDHFSGAVGQYNLTASTEQTQVKVNEPFHYTLKFEGKGNAKRIEIPFLDLPESLENYDTQSTSKYFEDGRSYKEFDFLFIPRKSGVISIPERSFSYFDPQQESYVQKTIPAWQIEVLPGISLTEKSHTFEDTQVITSLEDILTSPEVSFSVPMLSQNSKTVLWVSVYVFLGCILLGQILIGFGFIKKKHDFAKYQEERWKVIYQLESQKKFRDLGVAVLNLIQEGLLEVSTKSGVTLQELLDNTPSHLRKTIEEPITKLSKKFETLSFAPEHRMKEINKTQIHKELKELETLFKNVFKNLNKE